MIDREFRLKQAQYRMELRQLEVEIQSLRHEQRFYKRMGFGQDLQEMQMAELLEQKRACEQALQHLTHRAQRRGSTQVGWLSWLILSPLLFVMGLRNVVGRRLGVAPEA